MSEAIDEIIDRIAESPTKFAVLKLFRDNPYVMDNRLGLSLWVGQPEDVLAPELEELVQMGIVKRWGAEPGAIYAYTRDGELRRQIDERWTELRRRAGEMARQEPGTSARGLGTSGQGTREA